MRAFGDPASKLADRIYRLPKVDCSYRVTAEQLGAACSASLRVNPRGADLAQRMRELVRAFARNLVLKVGIGMVPEHSEALTAAIAIDILVHEQEMSNEEATILFQDPKKYVRIAHT